MSDRGESLGPQNNHGAQDNLQGRGTRFDLDNLNREERRTMPVHHRGIRVDVKNGVGAESNAECKSLAPKSLDAIGNFNGSGIGAGKVAADLARIPEGVRASVAPRTGEYDARRLRSQREIIRDVMLAAADCETWLTLGELRALTRYGEASISAQLRHLRKTENGGYEVIKRHREGASPDRPGTDGRGECVWEYRITREVCVDRLEPGAQLEAVGA